MVVISLILYAQNPENNTKTTIISYITSPKNIHFYLKDPQSVNFESFQNLKKWLNANSMELRFAMNGGMYLKDLSPQGLYIEKGMRIKKNRYCSKSLWKFLYAA